MRNELLQRIVDLEDAFFNLREDGVKQQIQEQLSGFLASCESGWGDERVERAFIGPAYFAQQYGSCKEYCEEAEGKTCLTTVASYSIKVKKEAGLARRVISDACGTLLYGQETCEEALERGAQEVGVSDDEYNYYPVYRSVGCSYQYTGRTYTGIHCVCCSFPS